MCITGKTLNFKFKGVKYGDVMHDVYLTFHQQGTLQKPNKHLRQIMRTIIRNHIQFEKTIKKYKINKNSRIIPDFTLGFWIKFNIFLIRNSIMYVFFQSFLTMHKADFLFHFITCPW